MKKYLIQNRLYIKKSAVRFIMLLLMTACLIPLSFQETFSASNDKPAAVIQGETTIALGQRIHLDGYQSSDRNGDTLKYMWTLISVPPGSNHRTGSIKTVPVFSISPDLPGVYEVKLVVNDGHEDSAPAYVTINVSGK